MKKTFLKILTFTFLLSIALFTVACSNGAGDHKNGVTYESVSRRLNHLFAHKQNSGRGVRRERVSAALCLWGELTRWFYLLLDKRFVAIVCHQGKLFFIFGLASVFVFL